MTPDVLTVEPRRRWTSKLGLGTLLATVAILVGSLLLEFATRVAMDRNGMHFGIEMWRYARTLKRKSENPNIGHEHVAGGKATLMGVPVEISSQGLRDREFAIPKQHGRRILILGDSMTFGWGAGVHNTYAKRLEQLLGQSGVTTYEVVNAGVGNYNTVQEVAWFERSGLKFQPDVVLLAFYINDAEPTPVQRQSWLAQHSYLYVFGSSGATALKRKLGLAPTFDRYYRDLYHEDRPGWQACQAAIRRVAAVCREHNIPLRMLLIPELHFPGGEYPFADIHAQVTKFATDEGVPLLDLQHAFVGIPPRDLWVSPGDAHPNAKAHQIIASELFSWRVDDRLWCSTSPADPPPSDASPIAKPTQAAAS